MSATCATCVYYDPSDLATRLGKCSLASGSFNEPDNAEAPFYANGNDGYHSWLHVRTDHGCNAHQPRTTGDAA